MKTVVCIKWGEKYDARYVNNLTNMINRHTAGVTVHCITEDPSDIREDVICHTVPDIDLEGWWWKMTLFNPDFYPTLQGEVLFLDLDIVLTKSLDPFFEYPRTADILTIQDFSFPTINSSVMRFNRGELGYLWEKFNSTEDISQYPGDQDFIDEMARSIDFYPQSWVNSWRKTKKLGGLTVFHGLPKPDELADKVSFIREHWK